MGWSRVFNLKIAVGIDLRYSWVIPRAGYVLALNTAPVNAIPNFKRGKEAVRYNFLSIKFKHVQKRISGGIG